MYNSPKINVPEIFGSNVFSEQVMKERLSEEAFAAVMRTMVGGRKLDPKYANEIASAMKDWAVEKGCTHYTHWFQPMTGITAEKHDSFITPDGKNKVIMDFSGKELIKGEPDASSFPSGGLRATFEARGYTAWDPTTYAFIKEGTLCIPTIFYSYGGEALDKKTPLLRSMDAISKQALRIVKLFGNEDVKAVNTNVGPEQEYFLIDRDIYNKREDLLLCGRTLFGAKPPKGQELDDHYFGAIKPRVAEYMKDLDVELWKVGVLAKTKHNEVAPAQHELAPIYDGTNTATDHNQVTMEIMKRVAKKHNLACLLHEKPFNGVNGSGKHNNWSLSTDTGINLLEPGDSPSENAQFLLFLTAVIKAVDEYQELLRISVATPGNDHRLGADEAPPAIVSIFLGDELTEILESIINDSVYSQKDKEIMKVGIHCIPRFPKDTTDRNRTSPFAFTGNKFEFRMLGSSASVSTPNTIINTIVAEALCEFADTLENSKDFNTDLNYLIKENIAKHKRIIFNGNNYSQDWVVEAEKRGLYNLKTTVDALPYYITEKNIALFTKHHILTEQEVRSRYEIMLENYCKTIHIEALTMIDMAKKDIFPAVVRYMKLLSEAIIAKKSVGLNISYKLEEDNLTKLSKLSDDAFNYCQQLESLTEKSSTFSDVKTQAEFYRDNIIGAMENLRSAVDAMEVITDSKYWPYKSYMQIMYSVD